MGLFDIFRRKNKENKIESAPASSADLKSEQTAAASSASQEPAQETSQARRPNEPESTAVSQASKAEPDSNDVRDDHAASEELSESQADDGQIAEETASDHEQAAASHDTEESSDTAERAAPNEEQLASETADEANTDETDSSEADDHDQNADSESNDSESTEERYDRGLEKSRHGFGARLNQFLANFRHVDEDFFDDLEDLLIESDVGYDMTMKLSDSLREEVKLQNAKSKQDVSNVIIQKMVEIYEQAGDGENNAINFASDGPTVIMFVGVNGAGKTTTIGKLAARYKKAGKKVLLAAADTFRAGAIQQLAVWAERDGVDIVKGREHGDPAAVVFDAVKKAKEDQYDVLLVDTAGRLQNKTNLMNELAKMKRVLTREIPDASHEVLLVLDATTGQNALNQAKLFKESTDVTGIVLTKLDGTARGGIVLAIRNELHLPVKLVGLGEKVDDLEDFKPEDFVYGLFKGLVEAD